MIVALALPRYGATSLAHELTIAALRSAHPDWIVCALEGLPCLDIVRAVLANDALVANHADHIVWIDSDISAPVSSVELVLDVANRTNAVAGAVYMDRRGSGRMVLRASAPTVARLGSGLFGEAAVDVDAIGFGLVVTPRTAFERIQQSPAAVRAQECTDYGVVHPWFSSDPAWDELTSDDYAFCRRARAAGVRVLAVPAPGVIHGELGPFVRISAGVPRTG